MKCPSCNEEMKVVYTPDKQWQKNHPRGYNVLGVCHKCCYFSEWLTDGKKEFDEHKYAPDRRQL